MFFFLRKAIKTFRVPNPKIAWDKLPVEVVTETFRLPEQAGLHLAGVSSFGLSGTNAHLVLEEVRPQRDMAQQSGPHLLTVSARNS